MKFILKGYYVILYRKIRDYEVYNLLSIFSYGILICFKWLIFIITCFMQINRIILAQNFTIKFIKKKLISLRLMNFKNFICILQERVVSVFKRDWI